MSNHSIPKVRVDTTSPGRNKSAQLWSGVLEQFGSLEDYSYANNFDNQQFSGSSDASAIGPFFFQNSGAGGTGSLATGITFGGEALLSATTGTAHFGVEIHRGPANSVGSNVDLSLGVSVFETRIKSDPAALLFVGLAEPVAELVGASSAIADRDYIGFIRTAGGDLNFVCHKTGVTAYSVPVVANADLPDSSTYQKLGFRVNPGGHVQVFVDGTEIHKTTAGVDIAVPSTVIPTDLLTEKYAVGRGAGALTSTSVTIDWVAAHCAGN